MTNGKGTESEGYIITERQVDFNPPRTIELPQQYQTLGPEQKEDAIARIEKIIRQLPDERLRRLAEIAEYLHNDVNAYIARCNQLYRRFPPNQLPAILSPEAHSLLVTKEVSQLVIGPYYTRKRREEVYQQLLQMVADDTEPSDTHKTGEYTKTEEPDRAADVRREEKDTKDTKGVPEEIQPIVNFLFLEEPTKLKFDSDFSRLLEELGLKPSEQELVVSISQLQDVSGTLHSMLKREEERRKKQKEGKRQQRQQTAHPANTASRREETEGGPPRTQQSRHPRRTPPERLVQVIGDIQAALASQGGISKEGEKPLPIKPKILTQGDKDVITTEQGTIEIKVAKFGGPIIITKVPEHGTLLVPVASFTQEAASQELITKIQEILASEQPLTMKELLQELRRKTKIGTPLSGRNIIGIDNSGKIYSFNEHKQYTFPERVTSISTDRSYTLENEVYYNGKIGPNTKIVVEPASLEIINPNEEET